MTEESIELLSEKRWILLDVEFIRVTSIHRCIRKLHILAENGQTKMELAFYPCEKYKDLEQKYQKSFRSCHPYIYQLSYNSKKYPPYCRHGSITAKEFHHQQ